MFLAMIASGVHNKESNAWNVYDDLIVLKGSLTSAVLTESTLP